MKLKEYTRRNFIKTVGVGSAIISAAVQSCAMDKKTQKNNLIINADPVFDLSPYLYMQFMEPLGTTDGSVAAAWNFKQNKWRQDVIEITQELAPTMMRWGGCFIWYYRWKEGVGPRDQRKPMINLQWGGIDSNQVGTQEFVEFCHQVNAEPLMCVNFLSEGIVDWIPESRRADAKETQEWVDYCNNPSNSLRWKHGRKDPYNIRLWQLGNETSYPRAIDCQTAAKRTVSFAKAMRAVDPDVQLIGWGDSGWAPEMLDIAGEHLQYIAFHHMFNPAKNLKDSPLRGTSYRKDPARTWEHLMQAYKPHENKINLMREQTAKYDTPLALTECHFALPGRNRCEVLSTWAAGVANARMMNLHERNGDKLKIATLADFCGTRWMVNAIMIPVPQGDFTAFMMPVAKIMCLYRKHSGKKAVTVKAVPTDLDVTASRTGDTLYLHVININRTNSVRCNLVVEEKNIRSARSFEICADPEHEVIQGEEDLLLTKEKEIPLNQPCIFPAASVSALDLQVT